MEIFLQTLTNGILSSLVLILIASGLCLIYGILNIVNFAHGEFYMLGAFGIWWLFGVHPIPGLPPMVNYFLALVVTMAFVALVGILVEKFIYRPVHENHASLMMISLGIMFILQATALVGFGPEDKSVRSPFGGIIDLGLLSFSKERLAAMISAVVVIVALYFFIDRTKVGKAMRAVAGDPEAALVQGIPTGKIFSIAMGVCCAIAGAGGVLVGPIFYVNPYIGAEPVLKAFAVVILGGLGSLPGALIGGFIIGIAETFVTTYVGAHFSTVVVFLIMIGVLIAKPTGLLGHAK